MTKSRVRKIYLEKQKSLSEAERNERSRRVANQFFEHFNLDDIKFLHVFLSIEQNREVETSIIYRRLWRDFPEVTTTVPRVNFPTMTLENLRFTRETNLVKNRWDISEPFGNELIAVKEIDAVLVPLLCFDRRGFRVGYGKGFYDKFLSECRADCLRIGLSYDAPVREISDAQTFDAQLDFCITPEKVFRWQRF